jgi:hypothetical protein
MTTRPTQPPRPPSSLAGQARYRRWVAWAAAVMALVWTGVALAALWAGDGLGVVAIGAFAAAYTRLLTWSRLRATATETDLKTARWVSGIVTAVLAGVLLSLLGAGGYFPLFAPFVLPFLIAEGLLSLAVSGVEPDRPEDPPLNGPSDR